MPHGTPGLKTPATSWTRHRNRLARSAEEGREHLTELNLILELMRILWRIVEKRTWISGAQCLHVNRLIADVGRMAGAWIKKG